MGPDGAHSVESCGLLLRRTQWWVTYGSPVLQPPGANADAGGAAADGRADLLKTSRAAQCLRDLAAVDEALLALKASAHASSLDVAILRLTSALLRKYVQLKLGFNHLASRELAGLQSLANDAFNMFSSKSDNFITCWRWIDMKHIRILVLSSSALSMLGSGKNFTRAIRLAEKACYDLGFQKPGELENGSARSELAVREEVPVDRYSASIKLCILELLSRLYMSSSKFSRAYPFLNTALAVLCAQGSKHSPDDSRFKVSCAALGLLRAEFIICTSGEMSKDIKSLRRSLEGVENFVEVEKGHILACDLSNKASTQIELLTGKKRKRSNNDAGEFNVKKRSASLNVVIESCERMTQGMLTAVEGRSKEAKVLLKESHDLLVPERVLNDQISTNSITLYSGVLLGFEGDTTTPSTLLETALERASLLGDTMTEIRVLMVLGSLHERNGQLNRSNAFHVKAEAKRRELAKARMILPRKRVEE